MGSSPSRHWTTHPFAQELRRRIDENRLTLSELHARLAERGTKVSLSTLSQWRSGARRPEGERSVTIVTEIEHALGLPPRTLTRQLTPSLRTGRPVGDARVPLTAEGLADATGMDLENPPAIRLLSVHSRADIGEHGGVLRYRARIVLQAVDDIGAEFPTMEVFPHFAVPSLRWQLIDGGSEARMHAHPSGQVFGLVATLQRPLRASETTIVETEQVFSPDDPPVREVGQGFVRRGHGLHMSLRFHPRAIPDWCTVFENANDPKNAVAPVALPVDRNGHGNVFYRDVEPGSVEIRWGYDSEP